MTATYATATSVAALHRELHERAEFARRMASISLLSAETDEAAALEQDARGATEDAACSRWHAERARRSVTTWTTKEAALRAQFPQQRLGFVPTRGALG